MGQRLLGHTAILALPDWALRPYRRKHFANWDEATVRRLGRNCYWDVDRREYGLAGLRALADGRRLATTIL